MECAIPLALSHQWPHRTHSDKAGCCDLKCRCHRCQSGGGPRALHDAGARTDDSRTARSVLECASPLALSHQWPHRTYSDKAGCCDLKCRVPPMPKRRRAAALHDAGAWTDDSRTARSVLEWARHLALSHQWPHRAHKWQGRLLRSKMPGATDARAAEGRAHSMTLARGRMILELRGASWSGPDIWRFPTIIVAFGLRAFISSG